MRAKHFSHDKAILAFLEQFRCATSRQLLTLINARTSGGYRPIRRLRAKGIIFSRVLDQELGCYSQDVLRLTGDFRLPEETDLQMGDAYLQAIEKGYKWTPGDPPLLESLDKQLPLLSAQPGDDARGEKAAIRVWSHARKNHIRELAYTDHDMERARHVKAILQLSGVHLRLPFVSFRDRPDPRTKVISPTVTAPIAAAAPRRGGGSRG